MTRADLAVIAFTLCVALVGVFALAWVNLIVPAIISKNFALYFVPLIGMALFGWIAHVIDRRWLS